MFVGRSRCLACGHTLGVFDLIPVLSFLFRRGRCRYCGEKIPAECLVAELLGAAGFVCLALHLGPAFLPEDRLDWCLLAQWGIWWAVLLVLTLTDLAKRIIPDRLLLALVVNRAVWFFVLGEGWSAGLDMLKAFIVPAALLILVLAAEKLMKRELMGGGDITLLRALALYLSWAQLLLTLVFGCLAGLLFAALTRKKLGMAFPFGPVLAAGALVTVCFGDGLIAWYFGLF